MGTDNFDSHLPGLASPASGAAAITPHDTNELTIYTRGIYVGGAGDIALTTVGGDAVTFSGALAGTVLPIRAKIVKSTNTTATNLLALYD